MRRSRDPRGQARTGAQPPGDRTDALSPATHLGGPRLASLVLQPHFAVEPGVEEPTAVGLGRVVRREGAPTGARAERREDALGPSG